ncbi:MAG: transketolase [Alphaproteobacteria bacterium]|nr:transketolase [Alphaproteobacteria bacterium]
MDKKVLMANAVRFLSVDAINKANSGHPGMPLGMADVATVLFAKFLKFNPHAPRWFDRDRFVLSVGHGSMLLYSLLYLTGFDDITLEDIKNFRQLHAKTAGHPEFGNLAGIDMTTGPLGQGISSAVGMALAERIVNAKFGDKYCNHFTYVIAGDGCLMEGISEEAASIAGHLKLNKLIVFWDNNNITIDGTVADASSVNQAKRFEAMGWNAIEINGHDFLEIENAILSAQKSDKPTIIACKTTIGFGSPNKCGTSKCHGSPLGEDETILMRKNLGWKYGEFEIPDEVLKAWRETGLRSDEEYALWQRNVAGNKAFEDYINDVLPSSWNKDLNALKQKAIAEQTKVATRKASQMCLEEIVKNVPQMVGGSADLAASNLTLTSYSKTIKPNEYDGNNIKYGIREHAMGAMMNGLALHGGVIPFGGTFFVFSDYMRPSMRLAALMGIRVIYVLTHDSIGVGEDGPTHQPVEHLASYRAMPNIYTFRPCDVVETAESWEIALASERTPSILALSRQNLPMLRTSSKENLSGKGAYVIKDCEGERDATIIATGSEVSLAVEAQEKLKEKGIRVAVVSMPCMELFDMQPQEYQRKVLGDAPRVAVEAATTFGWDKYADATVGMETFGASGKGADVYEFFGITVDEIIKKVEKLLILK